MRKARCSSTFFTRPLQLLALALSIAPACSNPLLPKELGIDGLSLNSLFGRGSCENPCGWSGQLCCTGGSACYTDSNNQAQCTSATKSTTGYWKYWTSSWVETETETDVITRYSTGSSWCGDGSSTAAAGGGIITSTWVAPSTTTSYSATATVSCNWDKQESSCGSICCASDQYCVTPGQCGAAAASSKHSSVSSTGISPAILPTSSTLVTETATSSPTTTVPFLAPVATGANVTLTGAEANNSGLSGGAIAGIVIGVIVGIILLILLCLYCCARSLWALIFGGRKKRTERTEYVEARHHRSYGGAGGAAYAASRPDDRRWYGSQAPRKEKKKNGFGNLLGIGAGLAGLAAVLGMKRKHDRKHRDEKSEFSSNYTDGSYSYYTSSSSESSDDRRTRYTRDTRRSSRHR